MAMELDDDLDIRELQPGAFEMVAVFRDHATGESFRLNLEQINRVLSGDMNEVHDAPLAQDDLLKGRVALMTRPFPSNM